MISNLQTIPRKKLSTRAEAQHQVRLRLDPAYCEEQQIIAELMAEPFFTCTCWSKCRPVIKGIDQLGRFLERDWFRISDDITRFEENQTNVCFSSQTQCSERLNYQKNACFGLGWLLFDIAVPIPLLHLPCLPFNCPWTCAQTIKEDYYKCKCCPGYKEVLRRKERRIDQRDQAYQMDVENWANNKPRKIPEPAFMGRETDDTTRGTDNSRATKEVASPRGIRNTGEGGGSVPPSQEKMRI